jgi:hypothetical protein
MAAPTTALFIRFRAHSRRDNARAIESKMQAANWDPDVFGSTIIHSHTSNVHNIIREHLGREPIITIDDKDVKLIDNSKKIIKLYNSIMIYEKKSQMEYTRTSNRYNGNTYIARFISNCTINFKKLAELSDLYYESSNKPIDIIAKLETFIRSIIGFWTTIINRPNHIITTLNILITFGECAQTTLDKFTRINPNVTDLNKLSKAKFNGSTNNTNNEDEEEIEL